MALGFGLGFKHARRRSGGGPVGPVPGFQIGRGVIPANQNTYQINLGNQPAARYSLSLLSNGPVGADVQSVTISGATVPPRGRFPWASLTNNLAAIYDAYHPGGTLVIDVVFAGGPMFRLGWRCWNVGDRDFVSFATNAAVSDDPLSVTLSTLTDGVTVAMGYDEDPGVSFTMTNLTPEPLGWQVVENNHTIIGGLDALTVAGSKTYTIDSSGIGNAIVAAHYAPAAQLPGPQLIQALPSLTGYAGSRGQSIDLTQYITGTTYVQSAGPGFSSVASAILLANFAAAQAGGYTTDVTVTRNAKNQTYSIAIDVLPYSPPQMSPLSASTSAVLAQGTLIADLALTGGGTPATFALTSQQVAGTFQMNGSRLEAGATPFDVSQDGQVSCTITVTDPVSSYPFDFTMNLSAAAAAPSALTVSEWGVTATGKDREVTFSVPVPPNGNGAPLIEFGYLENLSSVPVWIGAITGGQAFTRTTLLSANALTDIRVVTRNSAGASAPSDTKQVTPFIAASGPFAGYTSRSGHVIAIPLPAGFVATNQSIVDPSKITVLVSAPSVDGAAALTSVSNVPYRVGFRGEVKSGDLEIWMREPLPASATQITIAAQDGAITNGAASSAGFTGTVLNGSDRDPVIVGHMFRAVDSAGDYHVAHSVVALPFRLEAYFYHPKGIAAVEFTVTDGTVTRTSYATAQTRSRYRDDQIITPAQWAKNGQGGIGVYSSAEVNPADFADGPVTVTARAYARVGGAAVTRATTWRMCMNAGGAYISRVRYVDAVAGLDTNDGLTPGTAYQTLEKGCLAAGSASGGATSKSVGIVYLVGGTSGSPRVYQVYSGSGTGAAVPGITDTWLTIMPAPGHDKTTTWIANYSGTATGRSMRIRRVRFKGLTHDIANAAGAGGTSSNAFIAPSSSVYPAGSNPEAFWMDDVISTHHLGRAGQILSGASGYSVSSAYGNLHLGFWTNYTATEMARYGHLSGAKDTVWNAAFDACMKDIVKDPDCMVAVRLRDNAVKADQLPITVLTGTPQVGDVITGVYSVGASATVAGFLPTSSSTGILFLSGADNSYDFKLDDTKNHQAVTVSVTSGSFSVGQSVTTPGGNRTIRRIDGNVLRFDNVSGQVWTNGWAITSGTGAATVVSSGVEQNIFFSLSGARAQAQPLHADGVQFQVFYDMRFDIANVTGTFVTGQNITVSWVNQGGQTTTYTGRVLTVGSGFLIFNTNGSSNSKKWQDIPPGTPVTQAGSGATAEFAGWTEYANNDANRLLYCVVSEKIDGQPLYIENGAKGVAVINVSGISLDAASPSQVQVGDCPDTYLLHITYANENMALRGASDMVRNGSKPTAMRFCVARDFGCDITPQGAGSGVNAWQPGCDIHGCHAINAAPQYRGFAHATLSRGSALFTNAPGPNEDYSAAKTDLSPGAGSPLKAKVPAGEVEVPFDLWGNARPNDGTAAAGACEEWVASVITPSPFADAAWDLEADGTTGNLVLKFGPPFAAMPASATTAWIKIGAAAPVLVGAAGTYSISAPNNQPADVVLYGANGAVLSSPSAVKTRTPFTKAPITAMQADGWRATYPSPPTFDPILSPEYVKISRPGFAVVGGAVQATTYIEFVPVTKRTRQPYPNHLTLTASDVALATAIYSTDTILIPTGLTNSSTKAGTKAVANWAFAAPPRVVGNTVTLEIVAAHRNGRNFEMLAAVEFSVSDGVNPAVKAVVTQSVISPNPGDKKPQIVYRATLDVSGLNNPAVLTYNFKAYPWIGDAAAVLDSSTVTGARNCSPRKGWRNVSLATAPVLIYVNPATGNDTTGVASTVAATAAATPCATIAGALNRAHALNVGGNRLDGVQIRLVAGTHVFSTAAITAVRTQTNAEVVITRDPAATQSAVIVEWGATAVRPRVGTGTGGQGWIRFFDLSLSRTGTNTFIGESATTMTIEYVFENVRWTNGGNNAALSASAWANFWFDGITMTDGPGSSVLNASTSYEIRLMRGLSAPSVATSLEAWLLLASDVRNLGNVLTNGTRTTQGAIILCNFIGLSAGNTNGAFSAGGAENIDGMVFGQNVVEWISAGSSNASMKISADDPAGGNMTNCLVFHNTFAGFGDRGRCNLFYDETTGDQRFHTSNLLAGNIFVQLNLKNDEFEQNALFVGNWEIEYGVDCWGNLSQFDDANGGTGPTAFEQEYPGLGSLIAQGTPIDPLFVAPAAVTAGPTVGAGGGNYAIQSGSPAKNLLNAMIRFDLSGASRAARTSAGAYH